MLRFLWVLLLGLIISMSPAIGQPVPKACEPKSGQVAVFAERGWTGRCAIKGPGVHATVAGIGGPIRSIVVGSFARAVACGSTPIGSVVCDEVGFQRSDFPANPPRVWLQVSDEGRSRLRCEPAADEVTLFATHDGLGPCLRRKAGRYKTPASLGMSDETDIQLRRTGQSPSSLTLRADMKPTLRTGKATWARVCHRDVLDGFCEDVRPGSSLNFIFGTRSAWVYPDCVQMKNEVALFGAPNFIGPCRLLRGGAHGSLAMLLPESAPVRSIRVGTAVSATLCDEEEFKGTCRDLAAGISVKDVGPKSLRVESSAQSWSESTAASMPAAGASLPQ